MIMHPPKVSGRVTMKLIQVVLILSAPFLLSVYADNTPNLCTDDIPNLTKVKPSQTALHDIPPITVGSATYDGDADHFVVRPVLGQGETYKRALIYIPGTTDRPELSSCLIKSAAKSLDIPVLALSYQYLNSGDKFRNAKCEVQGPAEQIKCLEEQHKDAIDGGNYGATHFKDGKPLWGAVLAKNSLTSRLGDLLYYLHRQHPTEGWGSFLEENSKLPKWEKLVMSGHSQGAGHVAYLAKTHQLYGAVMISGPQDECTNCAAGTTFWIDEKNKAPVGSTFYSALGHWSEPLFDVMKNNWARMKAADVTINWGSAEPVDVGLALETEYADACTTPLVTNVTYASTSTCGGKEHCSTAIDDSVPFTETSNDGKIYLYGEKVWPALMEGADGKNSCKKTLQNSELFYPDWKGTEYICKDDGGQEPYSKFANCLFCFRYPSDSLP